MEQNQDRLAIHVEILNPMEAVIHETEWNQAAVESQVLTENQKN